MQVIQSNKELVNTLYFNKVINASHGCRSFHHNTNLGSAFNQFYISLNVGFIHSHWQHQNVGTIGNRFLHLRSRVSMYGIGSDQKFRRCHHLPNSRNVVNIVVIFHCITSSLPFGLTNVLQVVEYSIHTSVLGTHRILRRRSQYHQIEIRHI